jgi:lethal(2) giant larvae protein
LPFPPCSGQKTIPLRTFILISAADMSGNHSMIICSEEQFKVLSLPQLRVKHKEKLTAIDGSKVRKLGVISLRNPQGIDSCYRLNFDQGKKNEIQHHS